MAEPRTLASRVGAKESGARYNKRLPNVRGNDNDEANISGGIVRHEPWARIGSRTALRLVRDNPRYRFVLPGVVFRPCFASVTFVWFEIC